MTDMTPEPAPAPTPAPADPDRHQLPSGGWVVMGDYRTFDGGDAIAVLSVIRAGVPYGTNRVAMQLMLLTKLIKNWSFDWPLPATEKTLTMLEAPDLLALISLVDDAYNMINLHNVKPVMTPETMADPGSPSQGSSE